MNPSTFATSPRTPSLSPFIAWRNALGIVTIIFVIGKRSLTPGLIAHALTHFFGDPVLTMGILHGAIMLGVLH